MARKKQKQTYTYKCTLTEKNFVTTRQAPNPDELVSVKGYYKLNPEKDDRPEHVRKQAENNEVETPIEPSQEADTENQDGEV